MKAPHLLLSESQYKVLTKIAKRSGMDCWFHIVTKAEIREPTKNVETYDVVYDLQRKRQVTLKYGIKVLVEGMTSYESYGLSKREIATFEGVLKSLKLA